MKNCKSIGALKFLLGGALATAALVPSWAQDGKLELEQKPVPELPNSISSSETVRSRMDKFIREQGLRQVKDNMKDESGRTVLIDFAVATISASSSDPNFVNARIAAFNKAMLTAKGQCAEFQKIIVSTEAIKKLTLPPEERAKADAERMKLEGLAQEGVVKVAQALNSDLRDKNLPSSILTAASYGTKLLSDKMHAQLRKKGLDPAKPVLEQEAKVVANTVDFKNAVATVAAARCTGIKSIASFEQNPSSGQGSVGVVTVWSEKLHAIADAIVTNNWELIKLGEPGKTVAEHIPDDNRTLLTTYGTMLVRDEKGEYVVLAYAQAQPRTKNQQSIDLAYEVAKTRGYGLIRSFMGEAVEVNRQLLDSDTSTVFTDESTRYQEESTFSKRVKAVGDALPISGMTVAYEWETLHPANNSPVVGVVVQWKVASAQIAGHWAKHKSVGGATGGDQARPANAVSRKSDAYSGQGKTSRDY